MRVIGVGCLKLNVSAEWVYELGMDELDMDELDMDELNMDELVWFWYLRVDDECQ